MKFVVGFLGGLVLGAVGAVAYSIQTGRDLREIVEEVRGDLSKGDLDALGARFESRVSEMQRDLEARIATVRDKASAAIDEANARGQDVAEVAAETAGSASERAAEVAGDVAGAADAAVEQAADVADQAVDAAQDAAAKAEG